MIEFSQESTNAETTPGPGAYEVNNGVVSNEQIRKLRNDRSLEKIQSMNKLHMLSPSAIYGAQSHTSIAGSPRLEKAGFGSSAGRGNDPGLAFNQNA